MFSVVSHWNDMKPAVIICLDSVKYRHPKNRTAQARAPATHLYARMLIAYAAQQYVWDKDRALARARVTFVRVAVFIRL